MTDPRYALQNLQNRYHHPNLSNKREMKDSRWDQKCEEHIHIAGLALLRFVIQFVVSMRCLDRDLSFLNKVTDSHSHKV